MREDIKERVVSIGSRMKNIPAPEAPKNISKEYRFPDTSDLSSEELGSWMLKLASWKSYILRLLANADVERMLLDEKYDDMIAIQTVEENNLKKKSTKDSILGSLLSSDEFKEIRKDLTNKKAECEALKRIVEMYTTQLDAISREISRRSQDFHSIGKTI